MSRLSGIILLLLSATAFGQENKLFDHIDKCWRHANDDWFDYNVYVTYDMSWRVEGKFTYVHIALEPKPMGKRRYIGCNIKDETEKPVLTKNRYDIPE